MTEYEKIWNFQNLYKAHSVARRGKRNTKEVIDFEMNLASNLSRLSNELKNHTYRMSGYYSFMVYDPKKRIIHALHYVDRVVQHCICDEVLAPFLDRRLIYDNAACRTGKGTHFALERTARFFREHYKNYGCGGYILKCDIRKFFDNIDHNILKSKLSKVIKDKEVLEILYFIIDSYETTPGKGLPLGNQTSQWFAIFYLDSFDRLIKEKLQIKYYSRYMDDCLLIHHDKQYLKQCLEEITQHISELKLEFNEKTQIFPMKNGVNYLGWHLYLSETGKVVKKVKQQTKYKYKKSLKKMMSEYQHNEKSLEEIRQVICSYHGHLSHGHTWKLRTKMMSEFILSRE